MVGRHRSRGSIATKRWQSAFSLCCYRVLSLLLPDQKKKKKEKSRTLPAVLSAPDSFAGALHVEPAEEESLLSHKKNKKKRKSRKLPLPPTSDAPFVVLNVKPPDEEASIPTLDQTAISAIVKGKDIDRLLDRYGGTAGIAHALRSDPDNGIPGDAHDVARRQKDFGSNTCLHRPSAKSSFFHFLLEAFKTPTILVLSVFAAFSLGLGIKEHGPKEGWYDGASIFLSFILLTSVSVVVNFRRSRQFHDENVIEVVDVVRGGRHWQISMSDIVVGDVVGIKEGDRVPADGLSLNGHALRVDESSLPGGSDDVQVDSSRNPFLFSGSKVAEGYGQMLVTSVGMNTRWGKEMMTRVTAEQTPLQARLSKFTSSIGKAGLGLALLLLLVMLARYFVQNTEDENGNREFHGSSTRTVDRMNSLLRIIETAVTIGVMAIPESLPLALSLILYYSVNDMIAKHARVRKLSACETVASVTTICTGKTGVLTDQDQMKVTKFWLGREPVEDFSSISTNLLYLIKQGVALNTSGNVYRATPESTPDSGTPTEKAILSWAVQKLDMEMETWNQSFTTLHVEAFNSKKRRSGVSIRSKRDNTVHVHWKGDAEIILAMCSSYYDTASGRRKNMGAAQRVMFRRTIEGMAASSLRCIGLAHVQILEEEEYGIPQKDLMKEEGLILLGLMGIKEPCRAGVRDAVMDCRRAGVNVKMITGDNVLTAKSVATECGILTSSDCQNGNNNNEQEAVVVEGEVFRNYTREERMEKVDKTRVMARSSPADKLLMVSSLKEKAQVVAVIGDSTNDAPALKQADVGLCMGRQQQGREVATKVSSEIIILDNNFVSAARVLRWGRCLYNGTQKFIQLQLTVNMAALVINIVAAVSEGEVPFTVLKLLWVNLVVDTLGALALAKALPTMDRPPVGRKEKLITNEMWRDIVAQALYQIVVVLTIQFNGESIFHVNRKVKDSMTLNTSVLCQVFNLVYTTKLAGGKNSSGRTVFGRMHDKKNLVFWVVIGMMIAVEVGVTEFLKAFAGTERLSAGQWGACLGIAALSWPAAWLVKYYIPL